MGTSFGRKASGDLLRKNSFDIAVDGNGNVFATGYFSDSADFDPGAGTSNLTSAGQGDIFISKLDHSGNFVWARKVGGIEGDSGVEVTLDGSGNAYMAGYFTNTVSAGTTILTSAGSNDILVSKLDVDGNFLWTKSMGGTEFDSGYGIAVDGNSNVYTTGEFSGTADFDPGAETSNVTSAGASDIFISKLDSNGNFVWAKGLGGISTDIGEGIAIQNSTLYITGAFSDTVDFDLGAGTSTLTSAGGLDTFVSKLTLTPQIHYVRWDANGANNGTSWADAYTDLQSALSAAASGDEIWVAKGTYKPTAGTDRTVSFTLKNGVAIYGGFAGSETSRAQRDFTTNVTTLSGDIGISGDNSDNSYHVVVGSNTNNSAILDGFTITGGNANNSLDASDQSMGGGMYNEMGSPTVNNSVFINNFATFGAGMYNVGSRYEDPVIGGNPVFTNLIFENNSAVGGGGGMRNEYYSSPILTNVIFRNNTVTRTGGGMENFEYSSPILTDVTFDGNTAGAGGGGMHNWIGNDPTLTNVTFIGNTAAWGGGMGNYQSSPGLTNVTFKDNSVMIYGGGMSNDNYSNPTLANVIFSGNSASDVSETYGGGMTNQQSSPILVNVTFANNSASHGGGMLNRDADSNPTLTNVTMSGNTAIIEGGAIANDGNPVITNSILWGNTGGEIFNLTGTPIVTYSVVQGGYPGVGNIDADPLLGPLQDNGGVRRTMALLSGSPAIDKGNDANCPSTDQRGVARPQGSHCDIGSYESEPYEYIVSQMGDFNGDEKAEIAVFRPSTSTWHIYGVGDFVYGTVGDIPVPADYNGDGKDDIAVFRPNNSTWYIYGVGDFVYGTVGDIPVVADYNGDKKADIAVFRSSTSTWHIYGLGDFVYGTVGDIPVIADYNGDGKADIAVFRPSTSTWHIYGLGDFVYGMVGDIPVIADYNGDKKADIAVFRPSTSTWYLYGVGDFLYGTVGDIPV